MIKKEKIYSNTWCRDCRKVAAIERDEDLFEFHLYFFSLLTITDRILWITRCRMRKAIFLYLYIYIFFLSIQPTPKYLYSQHHPSMMYLHSSEILSSLIQGIFFSTTFRLLKPFRILFSFLLFACRSFSFFPRSFFSSLLLFKPISKIQTRL